MRRYLLALLLMACSGDSGEVSSELAKKCTETCNAQTTAGCPNAACGQCAPTSVTFDRIGCAIPWGGYYDCVRSATDICAPDECDDEIAAAIQCTDDYCATHSSDPACAQE